MQTEYTDEERTREAKVVRGVLVKCGAIITGSHIVFASGQHSDNKVYCSNAFVNPQATAHLANVMACRLHVCRDDIDAVVCSAGPTAKFALMVAEALRTYGRKDAIQVEAHKVGRDEIGHQFAIGREYPGMIEGMRVAIVEDVSTTGTSARRIAEAARACGAEVVIGGLIVNRENITAEQFGVPMLETLLHTPDLKSWPADSCRLCADGIPIAQNLSSKGA